MGIFQKFIVILHVGETLFHVPRNLLDLNSSAVQRNPLAPVCLSLAFTDAKLAEQHKYISLEGLCENSIEEWIGTGIKWIEENQ